MNRNLTLSTSMVCTCLVLFFSSWTINSYAFDGLKFWYPTKATSCELSINVTTKVSCDGYGTATVHIEGGSSPYIVDVKGPQQSRFIVEGNTFELNQLSAGDYTLLIRNDDCFGKQTFSIPKIDNIPAVHFYVDGIHGICGDLGSIKIRGMEGTAPYTLSWFGPSSNSVDMDHAGEYEITSLPEGNYKIVLEDYYGCTYSYNMHMDKGDPSSHFDAITYNGECENKGFIKIKNMSGSAPYHLSWTGPVSHAVTMNGGGDYDIEDLPAGKYTITLKDFSGCIYYKDMDVGQDGNGMHFDAEMQAGRCGHRGYIKVKGMRGQAPYHLSWSGPSSNSVTMNHAGEYDIKDLPAGRYRITMRDYYGCEFHSDMDMTSGGGSAKFDAQVVHGQCGSRGYIRVTGLKGTGPYHLSWRGSVSNAVTLNAGNTYDITDLPSGSYQVELKDYYGCTYSHEVKVGSTATVGLDLEVSNDPCKQIGDIWVTPTGGSGKYTVSWTGPSSGSAYSNAEGYSIAGVPSGDYTINIVDEYGCQISKSAVVAAGHPTLSFNLKSSDATNGKGGIVSVHFGNGREPHTVSWTGPVSNYIRTHDSSYDITNLPPGTYSITVTDANGCYHSQTITVGNKELELAATLNSTDAVNGAGGSISVHIANGRAPYTISWTGPVSGYVRINGNQYDISNLPPGTYSITITDADGIYTTQTIIVGNQIVVFGATVTSTPSKCDKHGSIQVAASGGQVPYTISWTGSATGSLSTSDANTDISLPSGSYTVSVEDATGKSTSGLANIGVASSDLYCSTHPNNAICKEAGSIFIIISGGKTPYQLKWDGPSAGGATVYGDYTIANLPAGVYTTTVIDAEGCSVMEMATVGVSPSNLRVALAGEPGAINVAFQSGTPNYKVSYSGPSSGSIVLSGTSKLSNLAAGLYRINIDDANGCTYSQVVRVPTSHLTSADDQKVTADNSSYKVDKGASYQNNSSNDASKPLVDLSFGKGTTKEFVVGQNYPNPFSTRTIIPFSLPTAKEVSLFIHDSYGKLVQEIRQDFSVGNHQFELDGKTLTARGVYYYTFIAGEEKFTRRMVVLR